MKFDGLNIEIKNINKIFYINIEVEEVTIEEIYHLLKEGRDYFEKDSIRMNSLFCSFIYFHLDEDRNLYFTKNIKKLKNFFSLVEDKASKYTMLELGYVIPPYTMFEKVWRLFPHSNLKISKIEDRYMFSLRSIKWNLKRSEEKSYDGTIKEFEKILKENLKFKMNKGRKNIFTLSGGVDSCLLLKLAKEELDKNKDKSITTISPGQTKEMERSKALSEECGIDHEIFHSNKKKLFEISQLYNKTYCEPIYDLMAPVEYVMIKSLKGENFNIIEGQAADSIFLGLPHNQAFNLYKKYKRVNFIFKGLSLILKGKTFNKGSRSGKFCYRLKKLSHILSVKSEEDLLASLIGFDKIYSSENREYISRLEKTTNALKNMHESLHYNIAYYFMYRILPVREMQKYRLLKDEGVEFSFPYIEGKMMDFFLTVPEEFWVDDERRKKVIFDLGKKVMPEIDFGDKTTPFYVETSIDLKKISSESKKIYEKHIDEVIDKELFIKSLIEYDSFKFFK